MIFKRRSFFSFLKTENFSAKKYKQEILIASFVDQPSSFIYWVMFKQKCWRERCLLAFSIRSHTIFDPVESLPPLKGCLPLGIMTTTKSSTFLLISKNPPQKKIKIKIPPLFKFTGHTPCYDQMPDTPGPSIFLSSHSHS